MQNRFIAVMNSMAIVWGITKIWQFLELLFYREIQARKVDDIIAAIFLVILYIYERRLQEEGSKDLTGFRQKRKH